MIPAFLVTLREGLEAALIVGIVLAYLAATGNRRHFAAVWLGVAGAVALSLVAGGAIFLLVGEFGGRAEEIFEGAAMFTAVAVLSYMIIWMKRQATDIRRHLQAQVQAALGSEKALALAVLALVAVGREGLETVLFMFATVRATSPLESAVGGVLGLAAAVALGYAFYRGTRRLNLRTFFNVTGVLLILFAAGLLALGIHEWQEAGLLPFVIEHVWDINPILNEREGLGGFLKALFGYNANPSLVEVVAYPLYLAIAFWYFFHSPKAVERPAIPQEG